MSSDPKLGQGLKTGPTMNMACGRSALHGVVLAAESHVGVLEPRIMVF